jgi:hypothetical protein
MQAGQSISVDASFVQPSEIHKDDPRHLENLMRKISILNAQAASDTKYDPKPPPRVDKNGEEVNEAFISPLEASDIKLIGEMLYGLGALSAIVFVMALFTLIDPKTSTTISTIKNGYTLIILSIVISLLNIVFIYFSLKRNEIIQWYPALKDGRIYY